MGIQLRFQLCVQSPAANSGQIGSFLFQARNSVATYQNYAQLTARIIDPTDAAESGQLQVSTMLAGTPGFRMTIEAGVKVGNPTGGDKGAGTLNAGAVYDDNSLLTCMALSKEFRATGAVDLEKWDGFAPDLVEPEERHQRPIMVEVTRSVHRQVDRPDKSGRLVRQMVNHNVTEKVQMIHAEPVYDTKGNIVDAVEEPLFDEIVTPEKHVPRIHRTAHLFKAMIDDGFDPRDPKQYFARLAADEALPGMPTQADWTHGDLSIGDMFSRKWLAVEMLAIVCNAMFETLQDHESRIAALESPVRQVR